MQTNHINLKMIKQVKNAFYFNLAIKVKVAIKNEGL